MRKPILILVIIVAIGVWATLAFAEAFKHEPSSGRET